MHKRVINIVNFIRGIDERGVRDLVSPVKAEIALVNRHGFPVTWLLQYDALVTGPYVSLLKESETAGYEYGLWFEVDRLLAEAAGIEWKGRYTWDYYSNFDFPYGYTLEERRRMCDAFVEMFRKTFGHLPKVMGSWTFDAYTLRYLHEKYGIIGACNCKDQWGTDVYTVWGGYFANAYYPSIFNSYMPASTPENQIDVPVFRMLGSDPLHQYDYKSEDGHQLVVSLEPVYSEAGGNADWVDWFLKENFSNEDLGFSYAQAGQENSFPAEEITPGLTMQFEKFERLRNAGKIELLTLGQTAEWFRATYHETPATAVTTLSDWQTPAANGVWYLSKNYRINIFQRPDGILSIRNWMRFDEAFMEYHLLTPITDKHCFYETLPVMDAYLWEGSSLLFSGGPGHISDVRQTDGGNLSIEWRGNACNDMRLELSPEGLECHFASSQQFLNMKLEQSKLPESTKIQLGPKSIRFEFKGTAYELLASKGTILAKTDGWTARPDSSGDLRLSVRGSR